MLAPTEAADMDSEMGFRIGDQVEVCALGRNDGRGFRVGSVVDISPGGKYRVQYLNTDEEEEEIVANRVRPIGPRIGEFVLSGDNTKEMLTVSRYADVDVLDCDIWQPGCLLRYVLSGNYYRIWVQREDDSFENNYKIDKIRIHYGWDGKKWEETSTNMIARRRLQRMKKEPMPPSFDLRDLGLVSLDVASQDAGTCYAFSSMEVVNSNEASTNDIPLPDYSVQEQIDHQGYLFGKTFFVYDYGRTHGYCPSTWYPLTGKSLPTSCYGCKESSRSDVDREKRLKLSRESGHHVDRLWSGGGVSFMDISAEEIRQELFYGKGSVSAVMDFRDVPTWIGLTKNKDKIFLRRRQKWKRVDKKGYHHITLVGFGEENKVKYFVAKNSHGPKFGVNGFFKFGESSFGLKPNMSLPFINFYNY